MKFFGIPFQRRQAHYLLIDVVVALLAIPFGHGVHLGWKALSSGFVGIMGHSNMAPFSFVITSLTTLYLADAYNPKIDFRRGFQISRLWSAVALALPLQFLAFSLFPHGWWGRNEVIRHLSNYSCTCAPCRVAPQPSRLSTPHSDSTPATQVTPILPYNEAL